MADRLWRAQVSFQLDSLIPEDQVVNTWYFDDDDDPGVDVAQSADLMAGMLDGFYDAIGPTIFPTSILPTGTIRFYDMAAPEPRVPIATRTINCLTSGAAAYPHEVALCMSFSADVASGDLARRRRGRIFLGPIAVTAGETVASQVRPTAAARQVVANAAATMKAGVVHIAGSVLRTRWAVYSPTTHAGGTVGEAFNDVTSGWLDNAFDTQRRRGPAPTSRIVF